MDLGDDVGARQVQHIIVPLEILLGVGEPISAKICLGKALSLNHGPHGTINYQNLITQSLSQLFGQIFHS